MSDETFMTWLPAACLWWLVSLLLVLGAPLWAVNPLYVISCLLTAVTALVYAVQLSDRK